MLRFPAAAEFMALSSEHAQTGVDSVVLQRRKHLNPLGKPAPVVLFRMDEKGGRFHFVRVFQGGVLPKFVDIGPGRGAILVGDKIVTDIGRAKLRHPVRNAPLGDSRAKSVGMADDPVGHISAVRSSCHTQTRRVNEGIPLKNRVREGHEIVKVDCAVFAPDVGKVVSESFTAPGIAVEYGISFVREPLHLVDEVLPVGGFRTAMDH